MDSPTFYLVVIKVVLIAYIIGTPFVDNAPITRLVKYPMFSWGFLAVVAIMAVCYDTTVACLFAIILLIWLINYKKPVPVPVQHFVSSKPLVHVEEDKPCSSGAFVLPKAEEAPLSADEYVPFMYASL